MKIIVFIIIGFLFYSCSNSGLTKDWITFSKKNYKIKYPKEWELNDSGELDTEFAILSPISSNDDEFRELVYLMTFDITGHDLDLESYKNIALAKVDRPERSYFFMKNKDGFKNGLKFQQLIFKSKNDDGDMQTTNQYYWIENSTIYVLTFLCAEEKYKDYRIVGEAILDSFILTI